MQSYSFYLIFVWLLWLSIFLVFSMLWCDRCMHVHMCVRWCRGQSWCHVVLLLSTLFLQLILASRQSSKHLLSGVLTESSTPHWLT